MIYLARFIGDPAGYIIDPDQVPGPGERPTGWVDAERGYLETKVRIDLEKAYIIEERE